MYDIHAIINKLKTIVYFYKGYPEQKAIFDSLLEKLRTIFNLDKDGFSNEDILEINKLKQSIENYERNYTLGIKDNKSDKIEKGSVVFHKSLYYLGVIDGTTRLKHLFENKDNDKEFRVRVSNKKILIAEPDQLIVVGSAYVNKCYSCRNYVGYLLDRCKNCGWFICQTCGACDCGYRGEKIL